MKNFYFIALLVVLAMALLFVDFYSKAYVYSFLPFVSDSTPLQEVNVFKDVLGVDLYFTLALNKGAAWGMFSDFQHLILVIRMAVIVGMLLYLCFGKLKTSQVIPFLLIVVGALGNVIDYFLYGSVIDFFHFNFWGYHFPVFNVADILITTGVCCLFFQSLFLKKSAKVSST